MHVKDKRYFVGTSVETLFLNKENQPELEDYGPLDQYILQNHDVFEEQLIELMYKGDNSLEYVCEFIINPNKGLKTETVVLESPLKLRKSDWVSINLHDKKDALNSPKGYMKVHPKKIINKQPNIPESLKQGNKKKESVPVVPYKYKNKV